MIKPGYKMTEIGEIPEEWDFTKIEHPKVSEKIKAGGTPLKSVKDYYKNGTIPFVKIEDIVNSSKYLTRTFEFISANGLRNSSSWLTPKESILFSMYASYGEVCINKISVATNQAIISIVPNKENVDVNFLYYELKNLRNSLKQYLRSTTQSNLNAEIVRGLKIILPPLPEQQKIAEVLSTADETIQKANEEITLTEKHKKGLMQTLLTKGIGHTKFKITEIGEIPEEWCVKMIQEYANVKYGRSNPKTKGTIPLIGSSGAFGTVGEALIPTPTIVIGRKGTAGAVWDIKTPSWPSDTSFYLEYKKEISQKFLFEFMSLNKLTGENAKTTLPSVKKEEIEKFLFPLPPIIEQQKIAEILTAVDNKLELLGNKKAKLEKLKKGLMGDLLTGKIRVKLNTSKGED